MFYQKYKPANRLSHLVQCYFIWEGYPSVPMDIESPPNGLCSMVYSYKKPYQLSNAKYTRYTVPGFFISGQALKNYILHINGEIGVIGVALKPGALHHITGIPMYGLTDERLDFTDVWPDDYAGLASQLSARNTHQSKVNEIEAFLLQKTSEAVFGSKAIRYAANEIFESKGQIDLVNLIQEVYMSRRTFERKFLEEVGLSPKTYVKIRRFGYTCSLMAGHREVDFMEVLHRGGYYDQSHFIKDFKYFAGRTPGHYVKNNVELANYVDQISIVEKKINSVSS